jgi:hypothetical protein
MFSNGTLKVTLQRPPTSISDTFKGIYLDIEIIIDVITICFSGFLVMAFNKATNAVIGTFIIPSADQNSKTLNCGQYDVNL